MAFAFWDFFTPFNQFGEPLQLVALELLFWAAIAIAEAFVIAAISVLIAHQKLAGLAGFATYDAFRDTHKELVREALTYDGPFRIRQNQWTESIAVGSKSFTEMIKEKLGVLAKGAKFLKTRRDFNSERRMCPILPMEK
jgi:hypothetical protein